MAREVRDTLRSIYGKPCRTLSTMYLASIANNEINSSVVCRNDETVRYPVGILQGTLTGLVIPTCLLIMCFRQASICMRYRQ